MSDVEPADMVDQAHPPHLGPDTLQRSPGDAVPAGYKVQETEKTGMPILKKA